MAKIIVGLYDTFFEARRTVDDLQNAGIAREKISLVASEAAGRHEAGREGGRVEQRVAEKGHAGAVADELKAAGIPKDDAELYAEGVRRGGSLVAASTPDEKADEALEIMERHDAVDIHERAATWREFGWTGFRPEAAHYTADEVEEERRRYPAYRGETAAGEQHIPIAEEELRVGKRDVERGKVRVRSHVVEEPVEDELTLREEHVRVERQPVDRPVAAGEEGAFKESEIELTERAEEPVISKEARVTEEVIVGKEEAERTERIHETVRHTEVEVEGEEPGYAETVGGFETSREDFRTHYQTNLAGTGRQFDEYEPAYRFGYSLARERQMRDRKWQEVEPEARSRWESEHRRSWEKDKEAVHYGWDRAHRAA